MLEEFICPFIKRADFRKTKDTVLLKAAITLKACFFVHSFACINALLFAFSRSD